MTSILYCIIKLVSKELYYLAAILHHYARSLNFINIFFIINFQKEKANALTLLIILETNGDKVEFAGAH